MDEIINLTGEAIRGLDHEGYAMGVIPMAHGVARLELVQASAEPKLIVGSPRSGNVWAIGEDDMCVVGMPGPRAGVWYIVPQEWELPLLRLGRPVRDILIASPRYAVRDEYSGGIRGYSRLVRMAEMPHD